MKYLPLVWAGLSRSRVRSSLAFMSIVIAFLLFGVLHGISGGFDAAVNAMSDRRIRVQNRVSFQRWLPLAQRAEIEKIPGVTGVVPYAYFGGYYQDPKNQVGAGALDMAQLFTAFPEIDLPQSQREAMLHTRTGALVGADLARKYHWRVGDRIAVGTPLWRNKDGSANWAFDIVGIYRFKNDEFPADALWLNFDYIDEARAGLNGMASMYLVAVDRPQSAARVCREIDSRFRNSSTPTLSQSEKDWRRSSIQRIGNIRFMVNAVVAAVLFTLLALTANTMMQSIRERIPEFAVLRTLGYPHKVIGGLVVCESLLLCVVAASVGLAIAAFVFPTVFSRFGIGALPMPVSVLYTGLGIAIGVALISSASPLWRALRLDVAAALARR